MSNPNTPAIDPTGPVVQVNVHARRYSDLQQAAIDMALNVLDGISDEDLVAAFVGEPAKVQKLGGLLVVTATLQVGRRLA